ncbi:cytochrome C assembly protein [Oceanobacillus zhaokaii]|uniref:Cytochrome C assembly protein n=1 Tax=Oceanobacillus zhaokaii TaxID=2052660 RepID=A0A345PHX4_9BACI|nr:cytochrome c biogenesis protein CcsA [Oceanobacillus zhaokaii]AXI09604.1 cytochrome C assembly protein [Oceanobacillus zhaokaii]
MVDTREFYEIILIIYALSVIGYFIDFIHDNQRANKLAFWLIGIVWAIQSLFLIFELFIAHSFPVTTFFDSLFFYSWVLITFSLIINRLFPVNFIVFFIHVFSFSILLLSFSANGPVNSAFTERPFADELLAAHITLAIISYGFFTIGFLFSLMYLIQYRFLKAKKGLKWMWRFGDLHQLDKYAFITVTIGVPLLLLAIILGIVWAYISGSAFYWIDMKTIGSILVLVVYIFYLILRLVKGYQGKFLSLYNTSAFFVLIINFFLFSTLSNFHF